MARHIIRVKRRDKVRMMKIDPKKLEQLLAMSDDALWREIVTVGKQHGFTLPEKAPPHSELEKLRSAVSGGKLNLPSALRIIDNYRKGIT